MTKVMSLKQAKVYIRGHSKVVPESVQQLDPHTYVEVVFTDPYSHRTSRVSAVATLNNRDTWNAALGIQVAVGKATAVLARRLRAWQKRQAAGERATLAVEVASIFGT